MTIATTQTTQHQMAGKMVNNELDRRMKEAVNQEKPQSRSRFEPRTSGI